MIKTFTWNTTEISYLAEGNGKTVVLLHGFGEDSHIWSRQIEFLKAHCQLIVPDLPGSGASAYAENAATIEDHAACIHALLEHERIASCIMLGHSMGGYITLAFADKYANLLTGFGFVHSTAFADSEEKKATRQRGIELMEKFGGPSFLKSTIPNLFSKKYKKEHPEMVDQLIAGAASFSTRSLQQYYRAMMLRPDRTYVLKSNPLPVLFVLGTEDVAAPLADVLKQSHLPLKSYIHVLENVGHMSMWEATAQLNDHLLAFINS